jgi:hypothetical protein
VESKEAHAVLDKLRKAKEEVKRLDAEYRKVCECNEKIPGAKFDEKSFQKIYKTCKYHEVTFSRHTERQHHASL